MDQDLDGGPEAEASRSGHLPTFYRSEYPGMVRLAHSLTGNPETAEDVVQEAFTRIHVRFDKLDNPAGYLRSTVVNICRDKSRRGQRAERIALRLPPGTALSLGASELVDVLLRLPYRQRAVLVLRYWGDWSESEIAEALHCRQGTVKTLASRGLARIKREMVR